MLSIIIPVYNEEESLEKLMAEIDEVASKESYDLEVIFIDDGSTDGSWRAIERLAEADKRVRAIRFRANFGKAAVLNAGFKAAQGDRVMTLDADLQDDPKGIPNFLAKIDGGLDVVSGYKKIRHDPWHKVLPSRIFNWMVSWLTGVRLHDHNCGIKCYRAEVCKEVWLYGDRHRFVPVLAAALGFRVGEIVVNHRPRQFGRSKYGVKRFLKGFLDLLTIKFLTGFGQRPQHLLGGFGLICLVVGGLVLAYLTGYWVVSRLDDSIDPVHLHERAAFFYSIGLLLLGAQCLLTGFVTELITERHSRSEKPYVIIEQIEHTQERSNNGQTSQGSSSEEDVAQEKSPQDESTEDESSPGSSSRKRVEGGS